MTAAVKVEQAGAAPKKRAAAHPPQDCGFMNEDLECLGCGVKLRLLEPGHCYAVEGSDALKT